MIKDYSNLECDLPPLENLKIELQKRYLLKLRDDFNPAEVETFIKHVATRLLAYQFGTFYDYILEVPANTVQFSHEFVQGYTNQLAGDKKEDFHKFLLSVKTSIKNKAPKKNNGAADLSIDWVFSMAFIDLFDLKKVGIINTEDLSFTDKEACFYGRSVAAVLVQDFYNNNRDIVERNFEVIKADDPANSKSVNELLSKQRDICLTRSQTIEMLENKKCVMTGQPLSIILSPEFSLTV
jgi:hypothetical protein